MLLKWTIIFILNACVFVLRVKIFIHRFFTSIHMLFHLLSLTKYYGSGVGLFCEYMYNNLDFLSLCQFHPVAL